MASKTLPDGRKVLVGSKADPDSSRYAPRTPTSNNTGYSTTLQNVEDRANQLIGERDKPTPERYPRYQSNTTGRENDLGYSTAGGGYSTPGVKTQEQIQADMTQSAQGEINALRDYESTLLNEQKVINEKNDRSTSSINTLTGMAGSTEANIQQQATTEQGQQANKAIQAEVELKIQSLLGNVRASAITEARAQREEARLDEETRLKNRAARQEEAASQLTNLAASGVTYEGLKSGDPESFAYLASQFGGEEALKGAFVLNTPQDQILDKRIEGGKYVIAKQNPITGKVTVETVDLGLPPNFTKTIDAGDRILAMPDNWDGDPSKLISIGKGLTPGQAQTAANSASNTGGIYDQLDFRTANAVLSQADKFASTPIVQTYNAMVGAANMVLGVDPNSKNPADHQAVVYNFAKMLDPESVVREGEYATIAKYSQSTVNKYKGELNRAINGTGFLSEQAIRDIQQASKNRLNAYKPQYDNVKNQTANRINQIAGAPVADQVLLDYEAGYSGGSVKAQVEAAGYDYEAMKADGLSDEEIQSAIQ